MDPNDPNDIQAMARLLMGDSSGPVAHGFVQGQLDSAPTAISQADAMSAENPYMPGTSGVPQSQAYPMPSPNELLALGLLG